MSNVTAQMVKELRDRTGAGMMECKKALQDANGDMEKAVEFMRKAGQAKADKKSSRIAAEGVISLGIRNNNAVMLEINCETDFVAKDENFLKFVKKISDMALDSYKDNLKDFSNCKDFSGNSVEEIRLQLVSKVGENVQIRRIYLIKNENAFLGHYIHGTRIGVVLILEKEDEELAKDICMHIAAMKPIVLNSKDISKEDLEKEKEIYIAQASESGKPKDIIEKMVEGKVKKYISEVTLLEQFFVKDNELTISNLLRKHNNNILSFYRMEVGEGIDKKNENFADEVMAQLKK